MKVVPGRLELTLRRRGCAIIGKHASKGSSRHPIRGLNEVIQRSHLPCALVCALDIVCCHDVTRHSRETDETFPFKSPVFAFCYVAGVDACSIIYDLYVRGEERYVNGALSNDRLFVLQTEGTFQIFRYAAEA